MKHTQPADKQQHRGRIVAAYGRRVDVEDDQEKRHSCMILGRKLRPVCGDRVRWTRAEQGNVVTAIDERDNVLSRPDRRGREEVIAANISQLVVVVAPRPLADAFITDRYLAAAEIMSARPLLVLNKMDLADGYDDGWLDELEAIGYRLLRTSAKQDLAIDELAQACADGVSIFVGQSGVGKSSLLNALVPNLDLRTKTVSQGSGEGRHTTTASVMHDLPLGGSVIDSPGVRDYAPAWHALADVAAGFIEIDALRGQCRFHNCMHLHEPHCAVQDAVTDGRISTRRYSSYRRLVNLMRQLGDGTR